MGLDSTRMPQKELDNIMLRLQMAPKHGGFGVTSQASVGQCAIFAGIAGLAKEDCIVRDHAAIKWLRESMSNNNTESKLAKAVRQQLKEWTREHELYMKQAKADTDAAKQRLGDAPLEAWELTATDDRITQRAMATVASAAARDRHVPRSAPPNELCETGI